jgi:hypothetical protein
MRQMLMFRFVLSAMEQWGQGSAFCQRGRLVGRGLVQFWLGDDFLAPNCLAKLKLTISKVHLSF